MAQSKQANLWRLLTIFKFIELFQPFYCRHNEFPFPVFHTLSNTSRYWSSLSVLFKKSSKIIKLGTQRFTPSALKTALTSTVFSSHLIAFKAILMKIRTIVTIACFHKLQLSWNLPFLYSSSPQIITPLFICGKREKGDLFPFRSSKGHLLLWIWVRVWFHWSYSGIFMAILSFAFQATVQMWIPYYMNTSIIFSFPHPS